MAKEGKTGKRTMGIRHQYESQLRLEKMCQKRHVMKSFKCEPQRQQCEPHGLDKPCDAMIPILRWTIKYPRLLMTPMSLWLINTIV